MASLSQLFTNNRAWVNDMTEANPEFFQGLAGQQAPEYLWIGCADSRVPANEIVGLLPGELFVHRNVANLVVHSDLNCLSVLQFAVEVLRVKHIIVCGHYRCGGVIAALENKPLGLVDNWLRHVQDIYHHHAVEIDALESDSHRRNRLCELNVLEQVVNVCRTTVIQGAWAEGQTIAVHGWIYDVKDGLIHNLVEGIPNAESARELHAGRIRPVFRGIA